MKRTLEEAARAVGGTLVGEDRPYGAVSTDSRTLVAGALFVALKGPKFDGGEFVAAAAQRSAVGALVEKAVPAAAIAQIVVSDTLDALQRLSVETASNARSSPTRGAPRRRAASCNVRFMPRPPKSSAPRSDR